MMNPAAPDKPGMTWKRWKRGLIIAILSGTAKGAIGLMAGLTWEQMGILFMVNVGADGLLYLRNHPIEAIHETAFLTKP